MIKKNKKIKMIGYVNPFGWRVVDSSLRKDKSKNDYWILQNPNNKNDLFTIRRDHINNFSGKHLKRVSTKSETLSKKWINHSQSVRLAKRQFIEFVFEGAELEGLGLTYAKTYEIINNFEKAKNKYSWEQIQSVKGMIEAYQQMNNVLENNEKLTDTLLCDYNNSIDFYEETIFAGKWRDKEIGIGGTKYVPPIRTPDEYIRVVRGLTKLKPNFDNALTIFATLCRTQCFNNGNKRTALVFTNTFLLKNHLLPIMIKDHTSLIQILVSFYENNDINTFIKKIKSCLK